MNIVLDTNVLVSALLSPFHAPGRILDLLLAGKISLAYDDRILAEYRAASGLPVAAPPLNLNLPDPTDAVFVEVAAAANAPLVTGNGRHFPPDRCAGILVLSPAAFLEYWQQQQPNQ
jgi:predicted nucleic acid-binding protein